MAHMEDEEIPEVGDAYMTDANEPQFIGNTDESPPHLASKRDAEELASLHESVHQLEAEGRIHDALLMREMALPMTERLYGRQSEALACAVEEYVRRCSFLALQFLNENKHSASFNLMSKAEEMTAEQGLLSEAPEVRAKAFSVAQNNLGLFYHRVGKFESAETHLLAAHEQELRLGARAEKPAATLVNLATVYNEMGKLKHARGTLAEAVTLLEALLSTPGRLQMDKKEDEALLIHVYTMLGNTLENLGLYHEAASAFGKAAKVLAKSKKEASDTRLYELNNRMHRCEEKGAKVPKLNSGALALRTSTKPKPPPIVRETSPSQWMAKTERRAAGGAGRIVTTAVGGANKARPQSAKHVGYLPAANGASGKPARPLSGSTSRPSSGKRATQLTFMNNAEGLEAVYGGLSSKHQRAFDALAEQSAKHMRPLSGHRQTGAAADVQAAAAMMTPDTTSLNNMMNTTPSAAEGAAAPSTAAKIAAETPLDALPPAKLTQHPATAKPPTAFRPKTATAPRARHNVGSTYSTRPASATRPQSAKAPTRPLSARREPAAPLTYHVRGRPASTQKRSPSISSRGSTDSPKPRRAGNTQRPPSSKTRGKVLASGKNVSNLKLRSPKISPSRSPEHTENDDETKKTSGQDSGADDNESPTGMESSNKDIVMDVPDGSANPIMEEAAVPEDSPEAVEDIGATSEELTQAAVLMQSLWRGFRRRRDFRKTREQVARVDALRDQLRKEEEEKAMAKAQAVVREQERRLEAQKQELALYVNSRRMASEMQSERQRTAILRVLEIGAKLDDLQGQIAAHNSQSLQSINIARETKRQERFKSCTYVQRFCRHILACYTVNKTAEQRRREILESWAMTRLRSKAVLKMQAFFHRTVEVRRAVQIAERKKEAYARKQYNNAVMTQNFATLCVAQRLVRAKAVARLLRNVSLVQAMYRGGAARATAKHLRFERDRKAYIRNHNAAIKIQNFMIGSFYRKRREARWSSVVDAHYDNKKNYCATKIQATWRMHYIGKKFAAQWRSALMERRETMRRAEQEKKQAAEMLKATAVLQRAYRLHLAKRQLQYRRECQLHDRIEYLEAEMRYHCAVKIQHLCKVVMAKVELRRRRGMKRQLDDLREWRLKQDEAEAAEVALIQGSVKRLQRTCRGYTVRRHYRNYRIEMVKKLDAMMQHNLDSERVSSAGSTDNNIVAVEHQKIMESLMKVEQELKRELRPTPESRVRPPSTSSAMRQEPQPTLSVPPSADVVQTSTEEEDTIQVSSSTRDTSKDTSGRSPAIETLESSASSDPAGFPLVSSQTEKFGETHDGSNTQETFSSLNVQVSDSDPAPTVLTVVATNPPASSLEQSEVLTMTLEDNSPVPNGESPKMPPPPQNDEYSMSQLKSAENAALGTNSNTLLTVGSSPPPPSGSGTRVPSSSNPSSMIDVRSSELPPPTLDVDAGNGDQFIAIVDTSKTVQRAQLSSNLDASNVASLTSSARRPTVETTATPNREPSQFSDISSAGSSANPHSPTLSVKRTPQVPPSQDEEAAKVIQRSWKRAQTTRDVILKTESMERNAIEDDAAKTIQRFFKDLTRSLLMEVKINIETRAAIENDAARCIQRAMFKNRWVQQKKRRQGGK